MDLIMFTKIPDILDDRGMTVTDLHKQMETKLETKLSYQSLIRLASKKQPVLPPATTIETLHKIATTLGVKVDDLYYVQRMG